MQIKSLDIPDVKLCIPTLIEDPRGYFFEAYNEKTFHEQGIKDYFVQDNQSESTKGILRGLHFQTQPMSQSKLVRAIEGEIFDVAVDLRPDSPTYKQWVGEYLSATNHHYLYVPVGFAHGFFVTSEKAVVLYKCNQFYSKDCDRSIAYNDSEINVEWPLNGIEPVLSQKDISAKPLSEYMSTESLTW
ncbi:dTDP-4-dehydrorhamnose 3,5-epimerase [Candidatus Marinamargulisbacteria bacterium SCGC AAA071-K20]|nr:dTDP-4-dehydrorhamnose 3,5-epimerase [Candidatus Marinamargulisbacteria bacterium SCGC AAA071-K20]